MIIEKEEEDCIGKLATDVFGVTCFYCGIGYYDRSAQKYFLGVKENHSQFYCYYDIGLMKLIGTRINPRYFIK